MLEGSGRGRGRLPAQSAENTRGVQTGSTARGWSEPGTAVVGGQAGGRPPHLSSHLGMRLH